MTRLPEPRTHQLSAGYGARTALERLTTIFPAGKITVIVGPGGSGKTTLLRALASDPGLREDLWLEGEVTRPPVCSFLSQQMHDGSETVEAYLERHLGHDAFIAYEEIWGHSRAREIRPFGPRPMASLSVDHRQLVRLAPPLFLPEPCVMLDEPVDGLADGAQLAIAEHIRGLKGQVTALVVTHHVAMARAIADHAVLIVEGRLVEAAPSETFFANPTQPRTQDYLRWGS